MNSSTERSFVIFDVSEVHLIDFTETLEDSSENLRKSIDGTKTFVKWDGNITPSCILQLTTVQDFYNYDEIINELNTPEWTVNI